MNEEITNKYEQPRQDKIILGEIEDQITIDGIFLKNYNIDLNELIQLSLTN